MYSEVISLTKKLINFKSITPVDDGVVDFLVEYLTPYKFKCEKLVFEDVTNLYARYKFEEPHFCFAGHTDVVPPGNKWSEDPFNATIKDGILYGRGAVDMKTAVAAFMVASIEFIEKYNFTGSISFLITGDEEAKAENGTVKMLEHLKKNGHKLDACIVGEPTCPEKLGDMIKYGRRGSLSFSLKIFGKQGHVAYPDLANNPIDILLKILGDLKELKLDEGSDDFIPSNLEITDITVGNPISNVIPGEAQAKFNIRFNNLHNHESLRNLIESICKKHSKNYVLFNNLGADSFVNDKESSLINYLKSAIESITGINPVLSTTGGTSDARFIKDYCQVIEFGLVNKTAHHVDEHVSLEDIDNLKKIYFEFLKRFFSVA